MHRVKISTPFPSLETVANELGVPKRRVRAIVRLMDQIARDGTTGRFLAPANTTVKASMKKKTAVRRPRRVAGRAAAR